MSSQLSPKEEEVLAREYAELLGVEDELRCYDTWMNWKDARLPMVFHRGNPLPNLFAAVGQIVVDMLPFDCPLWDCYNRSHSKTWCLMFLAPHHGGHRQGEMYEDIQPNVAAMKSAISVLKLIGRKSRADLKQAECEASQAPGAGGQGTGGQEQA